jgi:hypothetical protein
MMDNAFIKTCPAGNIKPGEKKPQRSVSAAAAITVLDRAIRHGGMG